MAAQAEPAPPSVSKDPILLYSWSCPYVHRVTLALGHKRAQVQELPVDLKNKPSWLPKYSPFGKVPAVTYLSQDGEQQVLYESLPLIHWVDEFFEGPALLPADPAARTKARIIIQRFNDSFVPAWFKLLTAEGKDVETALAAVKTELTWLQDNAQGSGPFLLGAQPSLVDATIGPWLLRSIVLKPVHGRDALADHPRLQQWYSAYKALPEVQATFKPPNGKPWDQAIVESTISNYQSRGFLQHLKL